MIMTDEPTVRRLLDPVVEFLVTDVWPAEGPRPWDDLEIDPPSSGLIPVDIPVALAERIDAAFAEFFDVQDELRDIEDKARRRDG